MNNVISSVVSIGILTTVPVSAVFTEKQVRVHMIMNHLLTKQAEVFRLTKYVQQYGYLAGEGKRNL